MDAVVFKLLFERGLAYQKKSLQWWCETDKTVLANEQVENGKCWRCGNKVIKKPLKQWFFKITEYADRLAEDLEDLDWSEAIKSMQRNWIGKSVGAEVKFKIADTKEQLIVFTTRPDTLYGATFMVLAPEHPLVEKLTTSDNKQKIAEYLKLAEAKTDIDRMETERDKTGVFTGSYAINPVNDKKIPIWVADYVLMGYGTGAIMAVPAHDERDNEFAKKYKLPIIQVVKPVDDGSPNDTFTDEGISINSDIYSNMPTSTMRDKIVADLAKKRLAKEKVNYKMRDWLISRQRYWGAPIPIVHCKKHGAVPVPDDQLPVTLPKVSSYQPTGKATSVLASVKEWYYPPVCGGRSVKRIQWTVCVAVGI